MEMLELSYIRWDHKMVGRYGKTVWCIFKTLTELPYDVTILGTGENSKPVFTQICMEYLLSIIHKSQKEIAQILFNDEWINTIHPYNRILFSNKKE